MPVGLLFIALISVFNTSKNNFAIYAVIQLNCKNKSIKTPLHVFKKNDCMKNEKFVYFMWKTFRSSILSILLYTIKKTSSVIIVFGHFHSICVWTVTSLTFDVGIKRTIRIYWYLKQIKIKHWMVLMG